MTTVWHFCTIFVGLLEEIFSHVSTKFYYKILKTSKVMKFLRKISKLQINQVYKTKKIFFQIFMFYSNLTSLQNWIMLENYLAYIQKPSNKTELKIMLEKLSGTIFHKNPLKRLSYCSERDCKRVSELLVDTLSTYFHSNQHSRPSHKYLLFQGRHIILKRVLKSIFAFSSLVNLKFWRFS